MKIINFAFLLPLFFILTGCPLQQTLLLYNNSNSLVVIKLKEREVSWPSESTIRISQSNADIVWEELNYYNETDLSYPLLTFYNDNFSRTIKLRLPHLGKDYLQKVNGSAEGHLQLENDGKLYVVPYELPLPVLDITVMIPLQ